MSAPWEVMDRNVDGYPVCVGISEEFANELASATSPYTVHDFGDEVAEALREAGYGTKEYNVSLVIQVIAEVSFTCKAKNEEEARELAQEGMDNLDEYTMGEGFGSAFESLGEYHNEVSLDDASAHAQSDPEISVEEA
jgi:hypothetical protein